MAKINVWLVFGTRPEAIKMLPLVHAMQAHPDFHPVVCVTGQHKEMLDQALDLFGVVPDINLNVMRSGQSLPSLTAAILTSLSDSILSPPEGVPRPDRILVHGDTTTTLTGALAAFYNNIPIGHVEAGLRTYDLQSPFPEEANRQLTGVITDLHFPPTRRAEDSLLKEGVPRERLVTTGNTVIDALQWMSAKLDESPELAGGMVDLVNAIKTDYADYILVTGHRRESHGDGFVRICDALRTLASRYPDIAIVYPVHPNPNVIGPVKEALGDIKSVKLIEPQSYAPFVHLMRHAKLILTDSGGVQEEAPSLGVPVLVMREVTERQEAVDAGTVKLVGTDPKLIVDTCEHLLSNSNAYQKMSGLSNPYGDGKACKRILAAILRHHNINKEDK